MNKSVLVIDTPEKGCISCLIGAFGVVAWCLHESEKDKGGKGD